MATSPRYPSLFQINTRVWLQRLSREAGRQITLVDIDRRNDLRLRRTGLRLDLAVERVADQRGGSGGLARQPRNGGASSQPFCRDLTEDDICGSGFAITAYTVSDTLGGSSRRWRTSAKGRPDAASG